MGINYQFDMVAFIILVILTVYTLDKYSIIDLKDRIYVYGIRSGVCIAALNLVVMMIFYYKNADLYRFAIIGNMIFLIAYGFFAYLVLCYTIAVIYKYNTFLNIIFLIAIIPQVFVIIGCVTKIFGDGIAIVNDSLEVSRGNEYYIVIGIILLYFIITLLVSLANRHKMVDREQHSVYIVPTVCIIGCSIQFFLQNAEILSFVFAIGILIDYLALKKRVVTRDNLTGLPNMDSFWNMVDYRIAQKKSMDVVLISLDDYRLVNQEFGHVNGNKFIQVIGEYIVANSPKGSVARYGGDEFAVVFNKSENISIDEWANMIFQRFKEPWIVDELKYTITVTISMLEYPTLADSTEKIMSLLEYTNSYAKRNGKNAIIKCDEEFKVKMYRRSKILSFLKRVVEESSMYVFYQPIYDVKDGNYKMAEALFRLTDEELGNVPPFEFFPIAEEAGCVAQIGYILIDKVCAYIASFKTKVKDLPTISVNFSRQQLLYEGALDKILSIIAKYDIPTSCLAIEIPEEAFAHNYYRVAEKVKEFDRKGIQFYLDGFGTGFLDLSNVLNLPFKLIKINKRMMWDSEKNDSIYLLVSALTAVFDENGKKILAEGIESENLKSIADLLFMNYLQGYYFCEPMNEDAAAGFFLREPNHENQEKLEERLLEIEKKNHSFERDLVENL